MPNPYPRFAQDETSGADCGQNPLWQAWEQGYAARDKEKEEEVNIESRERAMWSARPDGAGGG